MIAEIPLWIIEYDYWQLEIYDSYTRYVDMFEEISEILYGWWP